MGLPALSAGDIGGLDDLLQIIEQEVKPLVRGIVPVDADKEVLFGHSLGGMAVVHAAFVNPDAYDVFIASSPSNWWNNRQVLQDEAAFTAAVRAGKAAPRILSPSAARKRAPTRRRRYGRPRRRRRGTAPAWSATHTNSPTGCVRCPGGRDMKSNMRASTRSVTGSRSGRRWRAVSISHSVSNEELGEASVNRREYLLSAASALVLAAASGVRRNG
nr:alpha/beta fold hydrolase [Sphingopyxis panaciterrae]